jgi:hypothetical protein
MKHLWNLSRGVIHNPKFIDRWKESMIRKARHPPLGCLSMKGEGMEDESSILILKEIKSLSGLSAKNLMIISATVVLIEAIRTGKDIFKLVLEHKLVLTLLILIFTLISRL